MEISGTMKAFAVKIGTYVEIRLCEEPIKAITSKLTRPITAFEPKIVAKGDTYVMKQVKVKRDMVLKQVFYSGGKVVKVLSLERYQALMSKHKWPAFGHDKTIVSLPSLVTSLMWRKINL